MLKSVRVPVDERTSSNKEVVPRRDQSAWGQLLHEQTIALRRWAHRRLPAWARTISDTSDLVQDAVVRTLARWDLVSVATPTALQAYLRQCILNRIADEHRRVARRGLAQSIDDEAQSHTPSPLEAAVAAELSDRYKAALARLRESDRFLVVGHAELGYSPAQLACATGRNVPATRVALRRALLRLAEAMQEVKLGGK